MVRGDIEVKVMDNNCIHKRGPHPSQDWVDETDMKEYGRVLHFFCKKRMISQQSDSCMYPDYIKDPRCCVCYEEKKPQKKT